MISSASTERDLILMASHRENFEMLAPFVFSLKRSRFRGSVVVFASRLDAESAEKLRNNGVVVEPFHFSGKRDRQPLARLWPIWRWYFGSNASLSSKMRLAHRVFHMRYRRYLLYDEFLRRRGADFDRIFLADGRDVFFQSDPFAWDWKPGLHFFLEDAGKRIGACRLHRLWLGCQFGESFVQQHAQKTPVCSGTTFGNSKAIRRYLEAMITTTMRARNLAKIAGGDQGIHNYLLIQNVLSDIIVHENRKGPILTMGEMPEPDLKMDDCGVILNEDGRIVPILHQYDRIPALKERLRRNL